jgi:hypothetical protein
MHRLFAMRVPQHHPPIHSLRTIPNNIHLRLLGDMGTPRTPMLIRLHPRLLLPPHQHILYIFPTIRNLNLSNHGLLHRIKLSTHPHRVIRMVIGHTLRMHHIRQAAIYRHIIKHHPMVLRRRRLQHFHPMNTHLPHPVLLPDR